ncbi:receptor-type tyrosine-protein phosphatase eta isoform X2 [Gouania willdenowi]|uniref:receptor-type tyrosine-protein phosphatase eta isoform X2 n=1 Tax=Gouania willdenowi TaxID=441366 RepID=UPI00105604A7|nr:receptor-type tyrosine-protein phosphatase eta-like isoform X2 [Gouania willdenowi]
MKLRVTVSVWTLLVLCALTESKEQCNVTCERESLPSVTTTTTSITFPPQANCTVSVRNKTSESHSTVDLTPGTVYQLFFQCFNCCLNVATKPEAVTSLKASSTTSSILVWWTEPEGNWLYYSVSWSNGTSMKSDTVEHASKNITDLTAGIGYDINVTAMADDGVTEGESAHLLWYTKPDVVQNLTVMSTKPSEIHLNWVSPSSHVLQYKLEWHCGGSPLVRFTDDTSAVLSELIPGTEYTVTVTAVVGDNRTKGEPKTILSFTNPEEVRHVTITDFTTSSVSLEWLKPEGNVSFYRVQWMNESVEATLPVNDTYITISQLTPGVQYNFTVIAVAGDKETSGEAKLQYTLPSMVRNLHITDVMTSSLTVRWTKPEGNADYYTIQWMDAGEEKFANFTRKTSFSLEDLTAGSQYNISVAAGVNGLEKQGTGSTLTTFTRPGKPNNIEVTERGTEHLRINWTLPEGSVDHYQVNISNTTVKDQYVPTVLLTGLTPGRMFHVTVTAVAGNFTNMSDPALVATSPTPPGSILIGWRSNSSLQFNWTAPAMMENVPAISYIITYQSKGGEVQTKNSTEKNLELSSLMSGASYNVAVQTVGAQNLQSSAVYGLFFTLPNPVSNLAAHARSTTSVTVTWSYPLGVRSYYQFSVQTFNATGGLVNSTTVSGNSTDISNLEPGSGYDIRVTTVAAPGSESTGKRTFIFTSPGSVSNITAIGSTTNLSVSWSLVSGLVSSYSVLLYRNKQLVKNNTDLSNLTSQTQFVELKPGVDYCVMVTTKSGPLESNGSLVCNATFPNPPGFITVESQTTKSINFTWAFPEDMDHKQYNFSVSSLNPVFSSPTANNWFLLDNLQSGSPYRISVVTVGVRKYESQNVTARNFTMPEPVSSLRVSYMNTTEVQLTWLKPKDYKPSYSYLVMALQHGVLVYNDTTEEGTYTFHSLQAGTLYRFQVFTVVGEVKSTLESIESSTSPGSVSNITAIGSTTNLSVSWSLVSGLVSSYSVLLYRNKQLVKNNTDLSNLTSQTQFVELKPGVDYCVMVTTKSGPLESNGSLVCNATFPNPPGFITVESQTTKSINFTWAFPEDMDHKQYNFSVSSLNPVFSSPTANNWFLLDNLQSGSPYRISVVTVGVRKYESQNVTARNFTRPYGVSQLVAETLSTTAVLLHWMKPLQYKSHYRYWLETTGCGFQYKNLTGQTTEVSELLPGTNCTFCVSVEAANVIKGEENCISQYTKPETVEPSVSSQKSNSSMLVMWTRPRGSVEFFMVYLNSSSTGLNNSVNLSSGEVHSNRTSFLFNGLAAGRRYSAVLTTFSGPFSASSAYIDNATYPNTPGPIEILAQTTTSIETRWTEAPLMSDARYRLTLKPALGGNITIYTTTNTSHTSDFLPSGTSFNVSVSTLGALDLESEPVIRNMITTRPLSVVSLVTTAEERSVTVVWMKADDYKEGYHYRLSWQRSIEANGKNITTNETEFRIAELNPGSSYNISVTTETFDGTRAETRWISNCTRASPVTDLECEGPNKAEAEVVLSWHKPSGQSSGFQILINDGGRSRFIDTCCNYTVSSLHHYTQYQVMVQTESCGQPSNPVSRQCWTGITNPPIPPTYESKVRVSDNQVHNKFSLWIDPSLINDTNGPVTHVGVLVTDSSLAADESSDLRKYLGKTYSEWKAKSTPAYLATMADTGNIFQSRSNHDLIIEIGTGDGWNGYYNGALEGNKKYQCAIALFTDVTLKEDLVDSTKSLVSVTPFAFTANLPVDPVFIGLSVGATLGIFGILLIVLIGFIIYWKRHNKESSDIEIHSLRSIAVRVEDYEAYFRKQKADSNCGFAEEYEDLKLVGTTQSKTHALTLENKHKNRYNNVLPYDSSRVKLSIISGSPNDDYINANYMPGYNSKMEFIAAQGPLPTTVNAFWRMIWEKNVQTVVMLTHCNEQGRVKCEQYWSSGTKHFEDIIVTTTSEIPLDDWTIRDFRVKNVKTAETRSICHFHFTAWPDHGVPEATELLISFRHLVREHMNQYSRHSPTVVHCSAGVGRTGTFIAVDHVIFQIERENIVDVHGIVYNLRMHRALMVQTEDQYVFLNQCALDIIRSRTGTNVDLIYQNIAALSIYENIQPKSRRLDA